MKKYLVVFLAVWFLVGCGSNEAKKEFEGVKTEQNYVAAGMKYLGEADVVNAIRSFDMAIKEDPTNVENYIILGQVYLRLKEYGRAGDTFAGALRVSPNNGEIYYLIAMARALDGNTENAIAAAKKSVEIFMQNKNEERFKQSVALLRSLTQPSDGAQSDVMTAQGGEQSVEANIQELP